MSVESPSAALPVAGSARIQIDRALAACAAVFTALLATIQSGRIHPDEVYQFLEPANRIAFHFGFPSWEWQEGLRNWAVPAALASGMKVVDVLGGTSPFAHRFGVAVVMAICAYPGFRAVLAYAEKRTSSVLASRLALAVVVGWALSLYFLGRTLGEPMGALFGVAGIAALGEDERPFRSGLLAGLWLGLAFVVRYGFASLIVAAMAQALLERRWRAIGGAVIAGGMVALLLGALDWASWGGPWHSVIAYMRFNLGDGAARKFGSSPWWFYLELCKTWLPWPLLLGLPWLRIRLDRMLLPAAAYLYALSSTAYKVDRFAFPVVLLATVALAPAFAEGFTLLWKRSRALQGVAAAGLLAFAGFSAWSYARLPDLESDLFKATMKVGADPALKQLIIVNESRWGCGGSFYVGRDVNVLYTGPGYPGYRQAMANPEVNRAVIFRKPSDQRDLEQYGFHQVDAVGETTILAR